LENPDRDDPVSGSRLVLNKYKKVKS